MKIKKITITGMHKVSQKSYNLNDGLTYFVGPNGSGKSTVLEAIELALLGYIPGYGKTNESVMKHASGPVMSVTLELEGSISVTRTWMRSGSSVSSKESIVGYSGKMSELIADVELPIFNFDEFRSMTSNKLKEWFIAFLPNEEGSLNLTKCLEDEAISKSLPYEDMLKSASAFINGSSAKGIELVKALNSYLKDEQSYVKGQIAKLQGTVESLVRYDEATNMDESQLRSDLNMKKIQSENLIAYEATKQMQERLQFNLDQAKKALLAENFDSDPRVAQLKDQIDSDQKAIEVLQSDSKDINDAISELLRQRSLVPTANAVCPYTKETCETAAKLTTDSASKLAEIDGQIKFKKEEAAECSPQKIAEIANRIRSSTARLNQIQSEYNSVMAMQAQIIDVGNPPVNESLIELKDEIKSIEDMLIKIEANKQYDKLTQTVTLDKFKLENELEVLKAWAKLTDANGLQSSLMNRPFENLEADMSTYLTTMFGSDTKAKFNLVSKANSFSFGLVRNGQYIEFDYLSSGERSLFTLALIMCLLNRSNSQIRTIIIDDILDHLDSTNANQLFEALKNIDDIQFILAGVKECPDSSICAQV